METIEDGDIVTLGDSPTRWRAVKEVYGDISMIKLVNIGTPETQEEFSARAKRALAQSKLK